MNTIPERRIALGASFQLPNTAPTLMPGDTITIEAHATVETVTTGIDHRGEPFTSYHIRPDHRDDIPDITIRVAGLKTAPTTPWARPGNHTDVMTDTVDLIAAANALTADLRRQAADMETEITERTTKAATRRHRRDTLTGAAIVAALATIAGTWCWALLGWIGL